MARKQLTLPLVNCLGYLAAFVLLLSSPVYILSILGILAASFFLDSDIRLRLLHQFGKKPEESHLQGSVVWITGASSGIGEILAYRLCSVPSITLVLSARNDTELNRVASKCKELNCQSCLVVPLDITDYDSHEKCFNRILSEYGKVDVLINNAGLYQQGYLVDTEFKVMQRILDVNLTGQLSLTRLVAQNMKERNIPAGLISYVSSIASTGVPYRAVYSAAKAGMNACYDALRMELSETDIAVQLILPGPVETNVASNALRTSSGETGGQAGLEVFSKQPGVMSVDRSVDLIATALAHKVPEVWLMKWPCLGYMYQRTYFPETAKRLFRRALLLDAKRTDENFQKSR